MSIYKAKEVFIGGTGTPVGAPVDVTSGSVGQLSTIKTNGQTIDASSFIPQIDRKVQVVNKYPNGDIKISNVINSDSMVTAHYQHYLPARRCVASIGYNRQAATGDLVAPSTTEDSEYLFRIVFKNDKSMFSERPEGIEFQIVMTAGSTNEELADEMVRVINNSSFGSAPSGVRVINAVKVDNGAGLFGVEITGLDINQFQNTQYAEEFVQFEVYVNSQSAFGTTESALIQSSHRGVGTYAQAYNAENYAYNALNRTKFPIPTLTYLASNTGTTLTSTLTATTVQGSDEVTLNGTPVATEGWSAGQLITIAGIPAEVKYVKDDSAGIIVLKDKWEAAGATGLVVEAKTFYDILSVVVTDMTIQDGAGAAQLSSKHIDVYGVAHAPGTITDPINSSNIAGFGGQAAAPETLAALGVIGSLATISPASFQYP